MAAKKRPTEEDRAEALRRVLSGLKKGDDVSELATAVAELHPVRNTFPGEVFMRLAADALDIADVMRGDPIPTKAWSTSTYPSASSVAGRTARSSSPSSPALRSAAAWNPTSSTR